MIYVMTQRRHFPSNFNFYWQNFVKKQNQTIEDEVIWSFSTIRNEGKKELKISDFYIGFQCTTTNMKGWLNICTPYLVSSSIWLNLLKDNCHFFTSSYYDHNHFGYKQKFLKETMLTME